MKKYLSIFLFVTVFAVLCTGCSQISGQIDKWTAKEYYVQIQGNEDKSQHPKTNEYNLNAYNEDGEKAKVTFNVLEELKSPVVLRIHVLKSKDPDGNHFVKDYEKVKETELPEKVKEKIKGN
ncbi:YxeA family protein [Bacillus toyonensis]|uniref:YxeA family protein n=1 Tax=Bacillus toyonensis TaxID=155322 RepID=UPI003D244924